MDIHVAKLDLSDLKAVDAIQNQFKRTIGFFNWEVLSSHLEKGWVIGARTKDGKLVGYLLYAAYAERFRVGQLCVTEAVQGHGIGRRLIEALKSLATTQVVIHLNCRRDFKANDIWPALGFVPLSEKPGRNAEGKPLVHWRFNLREDDELGLWKANVSNQCLDIVIDAQVFFDFDEADTDKSLTSKALLSDFMVDMIKLWITDELFTEINRQNNDECRNRSQKRAHGFYRVSFNESAYLNYRDQLKEILPYGRPQQKSDIHHLAKAAASPVNTFVTKDQVVLDRTEAIYSCTGVNVVHPAHLIANLHELAEGESYSPARISGLYLKWSKARSDEIRNLRESNFTITGETKGKFREQLNRWLAEPEQFELRLLTDSDQGIVALQVLDRSFSNKLVVRWARVAKGRKWEFVSRFLIADSLSTAVAECRDLLAFDRSGTTDALRSLLLELEFEQSNQELVKFTLQGVHSVENVKHLLDVSLPDSVSIIDSSDPYELENRLPPVVVQGGHPCFLVPIRPAYAMGMIDRSSAADDLFGGEPTVLLSAENVYYRSATRRYMLKAPARLIWYVSGNVNEVIAISHLDEVRVDTAKELFREYGRYGVLKWPEIFQLCEEDVTKEIMALKFSRTYAFRKRIPLEMLRKLYDQADVGFSLQSPSKVPTNIFHSLINFAFPPPHDV